MNNVRHRERAHKRMRLGLLVLPLLAMLNMAGCESASSGHAPGLAGGETLTPGTTNYPLAYIKVPFPTTNIMGTTSTDIAVTDLITSIPGGDLYVRATASAAGAEVNVTGSITGGKGSVRDLDVSPDGTKVVFALRLPLTAGLENTSPKQPNWHIYQYDAIAKTVTQLTNDDITSGHDVGPHYLPDGRIVFASTRQTTTEQIELDEGRPQYPAQTDDRSSAIFALHVMNADGSDIHQISFNTNHDFLPSVMNDGQVLFSRWEVTGGANQISLYHAHPDGSGLELYYGANSHATGANIAGSNDNVIQFLDARQRPDGKTLAIVRPMQGTQFGGDAVLIDGENYVENKQMASPATLSGVGQVEATSLGITTDANLPSQGGRFASLYPLYDGSDRMLVSWSPCLVLNTSVTPAATEVCNAGNSTGPKVQMAPPQYSIWLYDFGAGTLSPVLSAESGTMILEPVILQARTPAPPILADGSTIPLTTTTQNLVNNGVGLLNITSVYDFDGAPPPNLPDLKVAALSNPTLTGDTPNYYTVPYRFVRIVKSVEIPDKTVRKLDTNIFGPAGMGMREILGYAPIQPDGSVQLQVPANVPFTIDILDANGRRVTAKHTSWMQLIPGETKTCNGCHLTPNPTRPSHGRGGLTASINPGAPTAGTHFPGANTALVAANAGEPMAAVLAENTCGNTNATQTAPTCSQVLATDVLYTPIWTTGVTVPANAPTKGTSPLNPIAYTYGGSNGLSELPPTNASCVPWTAQCRVDIHYASAQSPAQLYIESVWNVATRPAVTFTGTSSLNGTTGSPTCVSCHNPINTMNATQVPAGQLDLTGTSPSILDPTIVSSYEILLTPHDEQTLNMGVLTDTLVPAPGPPTGPPDPVTGLPTTVLVPVSLPAPMTAGSAINSGAFLDILDGTAKDPVLDHTGWLTPAELRLISEWLDIGAQYYNDPFVAPAAK